MPSIERTGAGSFSNSPNAHCDGERVEVRVSRDILVPIEVLKSLRYVKRDGLGRIEKALFEPSAEIRIKEQIDLMLRDIEKGVEP